MNSCNDNHKENSRQIHPRKDYPVQIVLRISIHQTAQNATTTTMPVIIKNNTDTHTHTHTPTHTPKHRITNNNNQDHSATATTDLPVAERTQKKTSRWRHS